MQPKTEELLHLLFWTTDMFSRPTFRNLTDSFECWAYRNGFLPQLQKLERQRILERDSKHPGDRLYRLTEQGRLHALGGRDLEAQWSRQWDGVWRLVLFDVPMGQDAHRTRLRRYLRERTFGCLQGSVWISPDSAENLRKALGETSVQTDALVIMEGRPAAGEKDADIVAGAWDFSLLRRRYERYLDFLEQPLPAGSRVASWSTRESRRRSR